MGARVIRYFLKERIADREFKEKRKITLEEIERATGVSRPTLTRIANTYGYSTTVHNLDRLCQYFGCRIEELVEHIPDKD